jgi:hypothetical protein
MIGMRSTLFLRKLENSQVDQNNRDTKLLFTYLSYTHAYTPIYILVI